MNIVQTPVSVSILTNNVTYFQFHLPLLVCFYSTG